MNNLNNERRVDKKNLHKKLAETIVSKLRDENFSSYLDAKEHARSITLNEYLSKPKKSGIDQNLEALQTERFMFLNGLTEEQLNALDKLILNLLDNSAFNFLREVEENICSQTSIGLTIENEKVENIQSEFLSGTLFGEYFLWVKEHSKFGTFQN